MTDILSAFAPISLEQMSGVKLMNRTDTKFVTNRTKLYQLLKLAQQDYYIQEIDGERNLETVRKSVSVPTASADFSSWRSRQRTTTDARRRNALR